MVDEWQTSNKSNKTIIKRAFVGNLTPNPNLEVKLRELFSNSNVATQKIDVIKPKVGSNCFALVQCNVLEAIKCLDGIPFQGKIITVKKEKKQQNNGNNNGRNMGVTKFGGGWAKPQGHFTSKKVSPQKNISHDQSSSDKNDEAKIISNDMAKSSVSSINTTLLEALDHDKVNQKKSTTDSSTDENINSFHSRCKTNLGKLMEEYGEFDPDFENMKVVLTEETAPKTAPNKNESNQELAAQSYNNKTGGMLAPNGSAPIHIELVSFGYKYSVPPQARQGWSYSNPLSPIDCRDLPRCPHHVAKLSGLSFKVKKALTSNYYGVKKKEEEELDEDIGEKVVGDHDSESHAGKNNDSSNPLLIRRREVSETILKAIEDAIKDGQHGYAFPLQASVHIGSEYGRHRSVVLCENIAQKIRKLLRVNEGNRISVPVSVGSRHRDVDRDHKDEEAFGNDLRRVHEAEMKRKKKQEWLESRGLQSQW